MYFNIINTIHEKSTTNIMLNDEKLKKFPLRLNVYSTAQFFSQLSCSMSSSNHCFLTSI